MGTQNRVKTIKALQSKKGAINGSKLHPNSRRAKQIQRVELRTRKLDIQKKVQRSTEVGRSEYIPHSLALPCKGTDLADLATPTPRRSRPALVLRPRVG